MDTDKITAELREIIDEISNAASVCHGIGELANIATTPYNEQLTNKDISAINSVAYLLERSLRDAGERLERVRFKIGTESAV